MNNSQQTPVQENVAAGLVGAFLFGLAGGIVWVLLSLVGFFAALSGFVGVICAVKGYEIFAKKLSVKGVVFSVIIAFLILVLAWYLCLSLDILNAYKEWYAAGEVDVVPTYGQCVQIAPIFLTDPEVAVSYFVNLGLGLLFALIGCFSYIRNLVHTLKAEKAAAEAQQQAIAYGTAPAEEMPAYTPEFAEPNAEEAPEQTPEEPQ